MIGESSTDRTISNSTEPANRKRPTTPARRRWITAATILGTINIAIETANSNAALIPADDPPVSGTPR